MANFRRGRGRNLGEGEGGLPWVARKGVGLEAGGCRLKHRHKAIALTALAVACCRSQMKQPKRNPKNQKLRLRPRNRNTEKKYVHIRGSHTNKQAFEITFKHFFGV